ncbi:MAG: hypothetical protein ACPLPR_06410 [Bacillota bacterium]
MAPAQFHYGYWKYAKHYAVPVHCAAALVIGRRAIGFGERVTKELKQQVDFIKQGLTGKVSANKPGEGEGMILLEAAGQGASSA